LRFFPFDTIRFSSYLTKSPSVLRRHDYQFNNGISGAERANERAQMRWHLAWLPDS